jgi:mannose-1-phosphate guanylyltransferase
MPHAVIMAGGAGTRLWPLSRKARPKQLLRLFGGKSLLRGAYERLAALLAPEQIYVITGAKYLPLVARELPELPTENLIGEPQGRDTANAVGLAAAVLHQRDPDAVMGIFTADHVITPDGEIHRRGRQCV